MTSKRTEPVTDALVVVNQAADWLAKAAQALQFRIRLEDEIWGDEPWEELPIEREQAERLAGTMATVVEGLRAAAAALALSHGGGRP